MFAQANSEHCRHKIFNADWIIDGEAMPESLFRMIKHTHAEHPEGTLVAYADNAAVIEGAKVARLRPDAQGVYRSSEEYTHIVMKVETHNHPTAISPFPGAATGSGGEIRDEGATGRGAKPKAGLDRFHGLAPAHSRLRAAVGEERVWPAGPHRLAAADHARRPDRRRQLQQRIRASQPAGLLPHLRAAGRRRAARLSQADHDCGRRGQHRANPDSQAAARRRRCAGAARRARHADRAGWRLGVQHGDGSERRGPRLRFGAARQRGDPAPGAGSHRPLLGAGRREPDPVDPRRGRGRAVERAAGAGARRRRGRRFDLRKVPSEEPGMSPMQVWCNEAQERYVLALRADRLDRVPRVVRARALPFRRCGHGNRRASAGGRGPALRQPAGRHGPVGPAGQAAEDDARCASPVAHAAGLDAWSKSS